MLVAIFVVPVAVGLIGFLLPARVAGWWATLGALASLVLAIVLVAGFDPAGGISRTSSTRAGSRSSASASSSASTASASSWCC